MGKIVKNNGVLILILVAILLSLFTMVIFADAEENDDYEALDEFDGEYYDEYDYEALDEFDGEYYDEYDYEDYDDEYDYYDELEDIELDDDDISISAKRVKTAIIMQIGQIGD